MCGVAGLVPVSEVRVMGAPGSSCAVWLRSLVRAWAGAKQDAPRSTRRQHKNAPGSGDQPGLHGTANMP